MRRETIDTDAERGLVAQLLGQDTPRTVARLYAELRIEPRFTAESIKTAMMAALARQGLRS